MIHVGAQTLEPGCFCANPNSTVCVTGQTVTLPEPQFPTCEMGIMKVCASWCEDSMRRNRSGTVPGTGRCAFSIAMLASLQPTICHYFIRLLKEKGLLLRCYTQVGRTSGILGGRGRAGGVRSSGRSLSVV